MFVDTSVVIAVLAKEPDARAFAAKLEAAERPMSAGHVILEASMRLSTLLDLEPTVADRLVTRMLREGRVAIVPITEDIAHLAVAAFERYGKGRRGKARLNFGDCLSYACAKAHGVSLLYKSEDFTPTDIGKA